MKPRDRAVAYPFSTPLDDAVRILAYAEVRALFLACAGVPWSPISRTLHLIEVVASAGPLSTRVVACMQARLRDDSLAALRRQRPRWSETALTDAQLGSSLGLEEIFHEAGRIAHVHRSGDPRLLPGAVRLADTLVRHPARSRDGT
jgi:hypothetical protein